MTSEDRPEFLITFKAATMEPGADVAPRGDQRIPDCKRSRQSADDGHGRARRPAPTNLARNSGGSPRS